MRGKYAIFSVMRNQPLIVYKTKSGRFVETKTFQTASETARYLRSEGCSFGNHMLSSANLENAYLRLYTSENEYEVDTAPYQKVSRVRKDGQA